MAFTLITYKSNGTSTSRTDQALAAMNVTTGNLLVVTASWEGADVTLTGGSVTDTAGNTYVAGPKATAANSDQRTQSFYCINCTGNAANIITVTLGTSRPYLFITGAQFSAADTVTLVDSNATTTVGTSITSPSLTTTSTNGLLYCGVKSYSASTLTVGANTTICDTSDVYSIHGYRTVSAPGSYTVAITSSASATLTMGVLAFNEGTASAASSLKRKLLLGVG